MQKKLTAESLINSTLYGKEPKIIADTSIPQITRSGTATKEVLGINGDRTKQAFRVTADGRSGFFDFVGGRLAIHGFRTKDITPNVPKVFYYLLSQVSNELYKAQTAKEVNVKFDLLEVGKLFEKDLTTDSRRRDFKRECLNAIRTLFNIEINVQEVLKGKAKTIGGMRLISSYTPSQENKNVYDIVIACKFLEYVSLCNLAPFIPKILTIKKTPTFNFNARLIEYFSIPKNHVNHNSSNVSKARIISIKTASRWTNALPTLEEVKETDRQYTRRILEPLERILDDSNGIVKSWAWCKAKGETIPESELGTLNTYKALNDLYIRFYELDNEDQMISVIEESVGKRVEKLNKKKMLKSHHSTVGRREILKGKNDKNNYSDESNG